MNLCKRYRPDLALWAAGVSGLPGEAAAREHARHCPNCAHYIESIDDICAKHRAAAEALPERDLPERVYRRAFATLASRERPVRWKIALATSLAIAACFLALLAPNTPPPETAAPPAQRTSKHMDLRLALNHSPGALEKLLEAPPAGRSTPRETANTLAARTTWSELMDEAALTSLAGTSP